VKIGQRSEKITRVNTVYEYKPVHMNKWRKLVFASAVVPLLVLVC
jgi:hypothetical protein